MAPFFLDLSLNNRGMIRARLKYGPLVATVDSETPDSVTLIVRPNGTAVENMYVPGKWIDDVFPVKATSDPKTTRTMLLSFAWTGLYWKCKLARDLTQYKMTATKASRMRDKEMSK